MNSDEQTKMPTSSIQESVLAKIQQREVTMRPRIFFVLKLIGLVSLTIFILIVSILIFSFVSFVLRLNGHDALLSFGGRGILLFFVLFPWPLLALDAVLVFLLRQLLRQFTFGYRSPWLPAIILLACISVAGGLLLDRVTPLNDALLHQADAGHLPPPLNMFYNDSRRPEDPNHGEYRGVIQKIDGNTIYIETQTQGTSTLIAVTRPPLGPDADEMFTVGEPVIVGGDMDDGIVHAFGIRPFDVDGVAPFDHDDHVH